MAKGLQLFLDLHKIDKQTINYVAKDGTKHFIVIMEIKTNYGFSVYLE